MDVDERSDVVDTDRMRAEGFCDAVDVLEGCGRMIITQE